MSLGICIDPEIGTKKTPSSLQNLCLRSICRTVLQNWKSNLISRDCSSYGSLQEFQSQLCSIIPVALYESVFELMVDSHARSIQNGSNDYSVPGISALLNTFISSNLKVLNLQCLRHMGVATDEEMSYFQSVLSNKLPNLSNLVEILLHTSGTDFTLPVCSDGILKIIGSTCFKLKSLDVSYNHIVTDDGLYYLIPSKTHTGCPKLVKFSVFECSVTHMGIVMLLQRLHKLKFLGYKETGECLRMYSHLSYSTSVKSLKLAHINNLGNKNRTCKDYYELECDSSLVSIISMFCPEVNALKVRVDDSLVKFLQKLTNVTIIDLIYNTGVPASPGSNTVQYIKLCGTQFTSLAFVCDDFSFQHLTVVCEQCCNLKHLVIRCNSFSIEREITISDKRRCVLTDLEECVFKVGNPRDDYRFSDVPFTVFDYLLHKSNVLTDIEFVMKSSLICDFNIEKLFRSIVTSKIKKVIISVPHRIVKHLLNLSTLTAIALINLCPELMELGNMSVWEVGKKEVKELKKQLHDSNSALTLVCG